MAAHILKPLYAATVIATNTTTTSDSKQFHVHAKEILAVAIVSTFTDGIYTITLQHSPDNVNWYTLAVGPAQNAASRKVISVPLDQPVFQYVRASIVSESTSTGATIAVELWHGTQR